MSEDATPKFESAKDLSMNLDRDDPNPDGIAARRSAAISPSLPDRLIALDGLIATAEPHPAGTTDRLLADDRER